MPTKAQISRLDVANQILQICGKYGRRFFLHNGTVSRFEYMDPRPNPKFVPLNPSGARHKHLRFIDSYSKKAIFVGYRRGRWNGFTQGGTLRDLVKNLADFIVKGEPIRQQFGPWHPDVCGGDLWGYGDDMKQVRREIFLALNAWDEKAAKTWLPVEQVRPAPAA
jgi:hypothetical protein